MDIHMGFENASEHQAPQAETFELWAKSTLSYVADIRDENLFNDAELGLRIIEEDEMTQLNSDFREQQKSTNVLSFPADIPAELEINLLGDIAICAPVIERESQEQNKQLDAHYAHMMVHGTLHLLGYDHISEDDAEQMEQIEVQILNKLGYPNPYNIVPTTLTFNRTHPSGEKAS